MILDEFPERRKSADQQRRRDGRAEIRVPQLRHFPRSNSHDSTGTLS